MVGHSTHEITRLLQAWGDGVQGVWLDYSVGSPSGVQTTESVYARVLPEAHRQMAEVMENVWERATQQGAAGTT